MKYLVRVNEIDYSLIYEFIQTWINIEKNIIPACLTRNDYKNKEKFINELKIKEKTDTLVCSTVYFLYDDEINKIIGASDIRHELNEYLLKYGGHIGDGIHPLFRNKGNGTLLIKLTLEKWRQIGVNKVLMVANSNNIASIKTILKNGGILENQIFESETLINRYWIILK